MPDNSTPDVPTPDDVPKPDEAPDPYRPVDAGKPAEQIPAPEYDPSGIAHPEQSQPLQRGEVAPTQPVDPRDDDDDVGRSARQ